MTDTDVLRGGVDNGRRATLTSPLYTGDVGVRDRSGGQMELAWFGRPPSLRSAVTGTLDGVAVIITGLRARMLTANQQGASTKAIVATAELAG